MAVGLHALVWGTSLRKSITATAGAIAAVAGAVVAVPPAWSALGLPELATRAWAQSTIYHPIRAAQTQTQRQVIDLQIDVANGKLDQLDNARASLEIEKQKAADDTIKGLADVQLRKIDRDAAAISDQIKALNAVRNSLQ